MKLFDNNNPQVNQTIITSVAICLVFIMVVINRNSLMKKYLIPVLVLAGIVLLIVSAITFIILHTKDQNRQNVIF